MKKLALAVTVLAFGAFMLAGCPEANNSKAKDNKAGGDNSAKCGGDNAADNACGG